HTAARTLASLGRRRARDSRASPAADTPWTVGRRSSQRSPENQATDDQKEPRCGHHVEASEQRRMKIFERFRPVDPRDQAAGQGELDRRRFDQVEQRIFRPVRRRDVVGELPTEEDDPEAAQYQAERGRQHPGGQPGTTWRRRVRSDPVAHRGSRFSSPRAGSIVMMYRERKLMPRIPPRPRFADATTTPGTLVASASPTRSEG